MLCVFVHSSQLFSQNDIDSLKAKIVSSSGTDKAKYLYVLAAKYPSQDTVSTFPLMREAFKISRETGYKLGVANYFFHRSRAVAAMGEEKKALATLNECFGFIDTLHPNSEWGSYYITLGGIYRETATSSGAYLKALKIFDQLNDTIGIARACHGLGLMQQNAGNINEAEKYYLKSMKYYEMAGRKDEQATMISNIGSLFLTRFMKDKNEDDFTKALDYLNKGLSLAMKIKNYIVMGNCYNNLASLYGTKNELDICLEYNFKGLEIRKRYGLKSGIASSLGNIAQVYHMKGRDDLAEKYILEAIAISEELGAKNMLGTQYDILSQVYSTQKKFESSLKYYKMSENIFDSLNSADKVRAMSELEKKYDSDKKDKEIELLNQTQQANDAEIARQRILNYAIGGGFTLVIIFSFFILRAYREKRKANNELHIKNEIIEEKNRNITDSINYAKTIQSAIIPGPKEFAVHFSDSFVLYLPKDIVSGDFYWITHTNNMVFFATVDCTGHGVPGGFMSMLGSSLLSEIVNERNITSPAEILNLLREKIMHSLRQTGQSGESKDGMDLSLCCLDKQNLKLTYANAFNSFYVIRNNQLIESEVNKMPVGYHHKMELFKGSEMQLQKGDTLYLFTDGYADQFGGGKTGGKKFKYSRMKALLLSLQDKDMDEQKITMEDTFFKWKGDLEQVDDICVIGIKI